MLFLHEFDFLEEIKAEGAGESCGYREFGFGKGLDFLGVGVDQIAHQAEGAVAVHFVSGKDWTHWGIRWKAVGRNNQ